MHKKLNFEIIRTIAAIALSLLVAFIIILAVSKEPGEAFKMLLMGPLSSVRHFGNVIEMMIPLTFTGLAVSVMFQAKQFNLGADGAFFIGAVGATIIALEMSMPPVIHPTVAIIFGGALGAITCMIPGILKNKWKANEVVSSLMLNYIMLYLGIYIIKNHLRDINAGTTVSQKFPSTAKLPKIVPNTRIHVGLIIVIALVVILYFFMYKSKHGYEIRMTGQNPMFAKYSGINVNKVIINTQILGGFIAGIGGAVEVLGMYSRFEWQTSPNYGWDGIIVAILARNNPALVPVGAFFLAYLRVGADLMSRMTDVQNEVVAIIQGIMIVLIDAESFLSYWKKKRTFKEATSKTEIASQNLKTN
ncbi:MAG TPA: ABC transporter permease [Clostridiaceae bacterium]|jgi:simple sugar transport system permease protein|nr:ABC transporter permease [Clostridiaceae bacterium]HBN28935.1 ABC transporter permease [Clostridiaceae bacterium]HCL49582.1 ABC transporter permease [Clostridiaceae bacterium]